MTHSQALTELMENEDVDEIEFMKICQDSVNPGICLDCGHLLDIEPDVEDGRCPECGVAGIISGTSLLLSVVF